MDLQSIPLQLLLLLIMFFTSYMNCEITSTYGTVIKNFRGNPVSKSSIAKSHVHCVREGKKGNYPSYNYRHLDGLCELISDTSPTRTPDVTMLHVILDECANVVADIVFLLDASGSVGSDNFEKQKEFVANFVNLFGIGSESVQIGVTTFSTEVHHQWDLDTYTTKESLTTAIQGIPYASQSTYTHLGLDYVVDNSFTNQAGSRSHVTNILVVMTDGVSTDTTATQTAANRVHAANIETFCIGISSGVNMEEVATIATDVNHLFTVENFDALGTIQLELMRAACVN